MSVLFADPSDVHAQLESTGYHTSDAIDTVVYLAATLGKPVLVEGPAGVGKTELARAIAQVTATELVRLSCYEGLDEAKALYEWDYKRQLLHLTYARNTDASADWHAHEQSLFSEDYLLERPLLRALRHPDGAVLLVDEVDKVDVEFEAMLLELLADFQVTIPELGTVTASVPPFVVLTSNGTRELSEALRRRCLYLHLDYPTRDRERAIVRARVPEVHDAVIDRLVTIVQSLRTLELRKRPSIAETIDWARTLVALGAEHLDATIVEATLGVLIKQQQDLAVARRFLDNSSVGSPGDR